MSSNRSSASEMNGVPPVDDEQPLISYNHFDRGSRDKKSKCPSCCFPCCMITMCFFMIVAVIIAAGLGAGYGLINKELDDFIGHKVALTNGSQGTDNWSKPGAAVYMSFYMFNLTNKEDFLKGAIPIIEEIGPFVYNESKTKNRLKWNSDETILEYFENTSYIFNKEDSNGLDPMEMNISTVNLPLIGFLLQFQKLQKIVETLPESFRKPLDDVISVIMTELKQEFDENLIMTRCVDEIVWGYQDKFLKFVADLTKNISLIPPGLLPPGGVFQLEHRTSVTGPNMVFTGKGSPGMTARYLMYDGKVSQTGWGSPYAQMINGTEALLFHPGVKRTDVLEVYVDELFRSGYFKYDKDVNEYGVTLYKFTLPQEELSNKTQDKGFNMNGPSGVLNLTAVFPLNVPVFVSKPHFLDADDYYNHLIKGPAPNRDEHDSFLCVEPLTGAVLDAAKRLQINLQLTRYGSIPALSTLPNVTYFPLLWVEERGKLNSSIAETFKHTVYTPQSIVQIGTITLAALLGTIALILLIGGSSLICIKLKRKRVNRLSVQSDE